MAPVGNEGAPRPRKGGAHHEPRTCCYEVWVSEGGLCVYVEGLLQEAECSLTPRALLAKSRELGGLCGRAGSVATGSLSTQLAFDSDNNPIRNVLLSVFYKEGNSVREVEMAQSHAASEGESGI